MALLDSPTDITYTINVSDVNNNGGNGITQSNDFDTWRKFTNALAEDIEVLSNAIDTIDTVAAPLIDPDFTNGTPLAPTASSGTNNTQIATTAFVQSAIANLATDIDDLGDVIITGTPSGGEILVYDSGWKNKSVSGDITINASGVATIQNSAINANKLASNSVTTAKITDGNVTFAKLAAAAIVTESEGIVNNDNNTTLPTSAAVKNYVDSEIASAGGYTGWDIGDGTTTVNIANAEDVIFSNTGVIRFSVTENSGNANVDANITLSSLTSGTNGIIPNAVLPDLAVNDFGSGIVLTSLSSGTSNSTLATSAAIKTYVDNSVSGLGDITGVTAGNGLTGGGTSGTVTLNVGQGTGILVDADSISLNHLGFQTLSDPGGDRIAFWDDSAGAFAWLAAGTNLAISGTTLNATNTTYSASSTGGLALSGTAFSLKNNGSLSNNRVLKWDDSGNQLVNTSISDDGSTVTIATNTSITSAGITTTGYLRGPASFVIDPLAYGDDTGTVVIAGNLEVNGTTTTINSATLTIDDLNIVVASDASTSSQANGAGLTINGANATFQWSNTNSRLEVNKPFYSSGNIIGNILISSNTSPTGEGGELQLAKPTSGTALAGAVSFDIYGDTLRIFENGGTFKGARLNITDCAADSQSRIIHSNPIAGTNQVYKMVSLTESDYNGITTKDANTLYIIV